MPDYSELLDDEVQRFISHSENCAGELPADAPISAWREHYLALCDHFAAPHPPKIQVENKYIDTVPCRFYHPETVGDNAVIIFFHGGGFVLGNLDSHDSICADISHHTQTDLVAVAYRLAPEFKHPAQLEDCLTATQHICKTFPDKKIILCGDSAGAWLAAMVSDKLKTQISGQVLIYPTLSGDVSMSSYHRHANAPGLTTADIVRYGKLLFGEENAAQHPAGPLRKSDFANLPETIIFSAECDPLHDDGPAYAQALQAAGGKAICYSQKGLIHGYLRGRYHAQTISRAFEEIIQALIRLAA